MKQSIVFIHRGNSWYLSYIVWQCKTTNPNADIYLIGDNETKHFSKIINHININEFKNSGDELKRRYIHHSTMGSEFEIACMERWFILADFLEKNKFENCLYLDSDVLVYEDMLPYKIKYEKAEMTWCSFSAHTNFISNLNALNHYCKVILDFYNGNVPDGIKDRSLYWAIFTGKRDLNISDMTFFHDYNVLYPGSLLEINNPDKWGCFDIAMEEIRVFEGENGFKKIVWDGKLPFCRVISTGTLIPMATLHFQGPAKKLLKGYFKYRSTPFTFFKILNDLKIIKMKVKLKISTKLSEL